MLNKCEHQLYRRPINYNSECVPAAFKFSTTWNQIEYDVLRTLNLHKAEFDANYKNDGQLVVNGSDIVKQFKPSIITQQRQLRLMSLTYMS